MIGRNKRPRTFSRGLAAAVALAAVLDTATARAQVSLADDIILASKGGGESSTETEPESQLGPSPGSRGGPFLHTPGTSQILLGGRILGEFLPVPSSLTRPTGVSSLTSPSRGRREPGRGLFQVAGSSALTESVDQAVPVIPPRDLGDVDNPLRDDDGPPGGLTLDAAIAQLVRTSLDLGAKAYEIPMAQADVLTAGLRENPLLFYDTTGVPYGSYAPQRSGEIDHGISLVFPVDYNGKRRARVAVATQAKRVLEAQYQDAVRRQIDRLYTAFVDVLAARQAVRYAETSRDSLRRLRDLSSARRARGGLTEAESEALDELMVEYQTTDLLVRTEQGRLRRARRSLAEILTIAPEQAETLDLFGSLRNHAPPPPPAEELVALACRHRPDLAAHRLGVERALADARVARADRLADAYLLYTPFTYRDNSQTNEQSVRTWGAGLFVSVPLFDRNQGNIRRSRLNVGQAQTETANLERKVAAEVRQALQEYHDTQHDLETLETTLLPAVRRRRDRALQRLQVGAIDAEAYLRALRDHSSVVRLHRDTIVRHRRAMLALNTTVGLRLLP